MTKRATHCQLYNLLKNRFLNSCQLPHIFESTQTLGMLFSSLAHIFSYLIGILSLIYWLEVKLCRINGSPSSKLYTLQYEARGCSRKLISRLHKWRNNNLISPTEPTEQWFVTQAKLRTRFSSYCYRFSILN